jgi:nicotinate-nucleotide--dimethylbenzimidazole phosphoribosyltransferase
MTFQRPLITPIANPVLEEALQAKLKKRSETTGSLGELEPLAIQLGLLQNTLKPAFDDPQIVVFAGDHGLAVDGIGAALRRSTAEIVAQLLGLQLPLAVFAQIQGLTLTVVDAGVAERVHPHARLLARKIAHGTRNARAGAAMSTEQVNAAIRAGMDIGFHLRGNAVACAGIGVGSHESAALVLSRLGGLELAPLLAGTASPDDAEMRRVLAVLHGPQMRHRDAVDPLAVLGAFGGFEMAMMVGLMLVAASDRHLLVVDGMPACAALMVASLLAPGITDYCIHTRSHGHAGLDQALGLFNAAALLELGIESTDGTGATLAWPLVSSAAALLTEVADGEDPGPTLPAELR